MSKILNLILISFLFLGCKPQPETAIEDTPESQNYDLTIAFGSCNKQYQQNLLWDDILKNNPDLWIWGGDNMYSDTYDMDVLEDNYKLQKEQVGYAELVSKVKILGTWDDHDYGKNDAGTEYPEKDESQELFLNFMNVAESDLRRNRKGVYHAETMTSENGSVKIIILDTRYFRTELTKAKANGKRYQPNAYGFGTILGEQQWDWLEAELTNSNADFNIIVSSIQFLSSEHGFETWGNFPHEVDKMKALLQSSNVENAIFISGDRHISEFSKTGVGGLKTPLIDFTSSGLTHTYTSFDGEPNQYRLGDVVFAKSFGLLLFNFDTKTVTMQMRGDGNMLLQELIQAY